MQFGRPTRQIQLADLAGGQHPGNQGQGGGLHHLGALGPRPHMAVAAGLVTAIAKVHLQGGKGTATEGREGIDGNCCSALAGIRIGLGHGGHGRDGTNL